MQSAPASSKPLARTGPHPSLPSPGPTRGSPGRVREGVGEGVAPAAQRVCLGIITGAHGVRGAVRVKSFTAEPKDVARYGPLEDETGERRWSLSLMRGAKDVVVCRVAGIADRTGAEALRGLRLYLPRAALPPPADNEYYHADLIGLEAALLDGTVLGQVRAIHDFGAGDTLEIVRPEGPPAMLPFTRAVVPVVDIAAGRLVVDPPPGLLDPVLEEIP